MSALDQLQMTSFTLCYVSCFVCFHFLHPDNFGLDTTQDEFKVFEC